VSHARFLVDASGLIRLLRRADLRTQWEQQVKTGLIATCAITELELLFTARSKADREELMSLLREAGQPVRWIADPGSID
jgi:predicted nucleic acid-binding protein